jgi:hypothetical protein
MKSSQSRRFLSHKHEKKDGEVKQLLLFGPQLLDLLLLHQLQLLFESHSLLLNHPLLLLRLLQQFLFPNLVQDWGLKHNPKHLQRLLWKHLALYPSQFQHQFLKIKKKRVHFYKVKHLLSQI